MHTILLRSFIFVLDMHPMGLKLNTKVLGKEFEDDSPLCGEMSRSDRGDRRLLGEPFFKRVFLNNYT